MKTIRLLSDLKSRAELPLLRHVVPPAASGHLSFATIVRYK
jgi:hypothetical protein